MAGDETKSSLSKNVLQMKFMKRSALRIEKEKSEEERKYDIDDEHWIVDLPPIKQKESKYINEPSYQACENLVYGRMSFQGFNPEVELFPPDKYQNAIKSYIDGQITKNKLMKQNNQILNLEEAERKEKEISVDDEEMAKRFMSLNETISKKFLSKRQRGSNDPETKPHNSKKKTKREFIKPSDD